MSCYVGADMFILHCMGRRGIPLGVDLPTIDAFNKMHASFKVRVEWGISGLRGNLGI